MFRHAKLWAGLLLIVPLISCANWTTREEREALAAYATMAETAGQSKVNYTHAWSVRKAQKLMGGALVTEGVVSFRRKGDGVGYSGTVVYWFNDGALYYVNELAKEMAPEGIQEAPPGVREAAGNLLAN